jgi:hypothetical protein
MSAPRRYRFGPLEQRGVVGPLRVGQVALLAVAGGVALGALYLFRSVVGLALGLAVFAGAATLVLAPIEGRTAEEWLPVAVRWLLRRRRPGYRSTAPSAGLRHPGDGEPVEVPALPPALGALDMLEVPYGRREVGVLRDRRAGTYTVAIAVRAGAFGLRDGGEQERKLAAWGSVLASCARDGSPVRRLQWVETTLPGQADELAAHFQAERDRTVPLESELVRSYIELIEQAAPVTQEHEIVIALQIDQRRAGRELRRLGGGDEGACAVLLREAENLAENLTAAEVTVFGLLQPDHYAAAIKDAFDPFGRQARARAAVAQGADAGVEPAQMGPEADRTSWGHYQTDSAVHATYWISSWPRSDVGPMFMAPLLMQTTALRRVSVTIEPIPYSVALRRAEAAQTAEVAEEMQRQRQGFMTTARLRRRQQAASRREEELADGHAEFRFAGYVSGYERSVDALERSTPSIEHAGALARLELRRLWGEQDAAFANTLPICRGLA